MFRIATIIVAVALGFAALVSQGRAAEWEPYVEFRDTVKPDTVAEALARQGKISVQPWTEGEKAALRSHIEKVFARAPGLFRLGASQGPIPLYRIDLGSSFGGHGALWFSYISIGVVAHELTHVADGEHKIARSAEFRNLAEPRIKNLRAVMLEMGYTDYSSEEANSRIDVIYAAGLPSFYAAATIQETLAEYVRAWVMTPEFAPPLEIRKFIQRRLIDAMPETDPSIALYRSGKAARLNGDNETAESQLSKAIARDSSFAEAYFERGLYSVAVSQLDNAGDDFFRASELMSEFDWEFQNVQEWLEILGL